MEDCSLIHDCEIAHTVDPANDEYNKQRMLADAALWMGRKVISDWTGKLLSKLREEVGRLSANDEYNRRHVEGLLKTL